MPQIPQIPQILKTIKKQFLIRMSRIYKSKHVWASEGGFTVVVTIRIVHGIKVYEIGYAPKYNLDDVEFITTPYLVTACDGL
jgi:hypothetical protein